MKNRNLIADKTATYWWEMQMNPDQRVRKLTGYGKIEGHNENKSKDQNLMRIVSMLYSRGYFLKTFEICIYERVGPMACIEVDKIILVITPGEWKYLGDSTDVEKFISNFRDSIDKGIGPRVHLRPLSNRREIAV